MRAWQRLAAAQIAAGRPEEARASFANVLRLQPDFGRPYLDATYPFGHVCTPEDVARVVLFFVSDAAGYVTGQRVGVNGGGPMTRR